MRDTIPNVLKDDRHTRNLQIRHNTTVRETMGKAKRTAVDGGYLDPDEAERVSNYCKHSGIPEDLSNNLDTRNAVLQRINSGIVYAEYPLAPYSKREIRPIQS